MFIEHPTFNIQRRTSTGEAAGEPAVGRWRLERGGWRFRSQRSGAINRAFTLSEVMIAMGLGSLLMLILGMLVMHTTRSLASMNNYVDLNRQAQSALDQMTRDIRGAYRLVYFSTNSLTFEDINGPGKLLQYVFDRDAKKLTCIKNGEAPKVYLHGCDDLQFAIFQHTPMSNVFEAFPPASLSEAKVIQVTWACSRQILGAKVNSENIQSAKIVIRNK